MDEDYENATDLVEQIVIALVDDTDSVEVAGHEEDGSFVIEITVNPDEAGKIIGRQGRMIKAIRQLTRAAFDGPLEVEVLG